MMTLTQQCRGYLNLSRNSFWRQNDWSLLFCQITKWQQHLHLGNPACFWSQGGSIPRSQRISIVGLPGNLLSTGGRDLYRWSRWHAGLVPVLFFRILPSRCGWTTVCGPSAPSSTLGWLPHVGVIVPNPVNATATAQELGGDQCHQNCVRQRPYSTDRLCRTVAWLCINVSCHLLLSCFLGGFQAKSV